MTGLEMNHATGHLMCRFLTRDGLTAWGTLPLSLADYRIEKLPYRIRRALYLKPVLCSVLAGEVSCDNSAMNEIRQYELISRDSVTYQEV